MAYVIAKNTSERIDHIMWHMPISQVFKFIALTYEANTGEDVKTHEQRAVVRKQQEIAKCLTH